MLSRRVDDGSDSKLGQIQVIRDNIKTRLSDVGLHIINSIITYSWRFDSQNMF